MKLSRKHDSFSEWNISIDQGSECIRTLLISTKPFVWRQSVLIQLSLLSQTAWTSVPHIRSLSHICINRCYQHGDKSSPGRWRSSRLALLSLHNAVHHIISAWRCIGWAAACLSVRLLVFLWEWSESWLWHRRVLCLSLAKAKQKEKVISLETLPQMLSVIMTVFSNRQSECMNLMKQTWKSNYFIHMNQVFGSENIISMCRGFIL